MSAIGFSARPREFAGRVLSVRDAAAQAIGHSLHGDVALVFGTEMSGLSNADLARCGMVGTIPANRDYASLNLAAAVQVVAYELRVAAMGEDVWRAPRFQPATADEIEALRASPLWPVRLAAAPTIPRECHAEHDWVYEPGQFDRITAPTLMLTGSDSVPAVAEATSRAAAEIPGARVHVLDGHGHFAHKTEPAMVAALVRQFLAG